MADGGAEDGSPRRIRPPSLADALLPIGALVVLLGLTFYLFGDNASAGPNQIALVFCALIAAGVAVKNGMPWEGLRQATVDGIASGLSAILILLAVGALIGTWALSGTIVTMVAYGLKLLSPSYFYCTSGLISAAVALCIGSSWTVAGTIGIGLMGVADAAGLSPAITAGAVISGAYFGDKASPLSDTVNLAAASAGSDVFAHIRESLFTSVPSLLLALLLFALLGRPGNFDATATLAGLERNFVVSPWAFLPLAFVLALAVLRFPPFVTISPGPCSAASWRSSSTRTPSSRSRPTRASAGRWRCSRASGAPSPRATAPPRATRRSTSCCRAAAWRACSARSG